jgi:hypothetical protein
MIPSLKPVPFMRLDSLYGSFRADSIITNSVQLFVLFARVERRRIESGLSLLSAKGIDCCDILRDDARLRCLWAQGDR